MATFYGGEQLVEVKTFHKAGTNSAAYTIYTVPAGRYAVFFIRQCLLDSLTKINIIYANGHETEVLDYSSDIPFSQVGDGYILNAGDQVRFAAGGTRAENYAMTAKEYTLP